MQPRGHALIIRATVVVDVVVLTVYVVIQTVT
jgi:hypothetical protein